MPTSTLQMEAHGMWGAVHPRELGIRSGDRMTVVLRRLVVVATLVAVLCAVHMVMTALGINILAITGLAFVLALVVLGLIIDLGAIIYGAEPRERQGSR